MSRQCKNRWLSQTVEKNSKSFWNLSASILKPKKKIKIPESRDAQICKYFSEIASNTRTPKRVYTYEPRPHTLAKFKLFNETTLKKTF